MTISNCVNWNWSWFGGMKMVSTLIATPFASDPRHLNATPFRRRRFGSRIASSWHLNSSSRTVIPISVTITSPKICAEELLNASKGERARDRVPSHLIAGLSQIKSIHKKWPPRRRFGTVSTETVTHTHTRWNRAQKKLNRARQDHQEEEEERRGE